MIAKTLADITPQDLDDLRTNEVGESLTLDYKLTLPGTGADEKKEFLRDVTAFANSAGGDLVFGIRERGDGVPETVEGVELTNPDETVLRLENTIRDAVAPRLSGCRFKTVRLNDQRYVIVLRVPKSWAAPHMVTFKASPGFYARNSVGKYPLDVSELRAAFLLSDTLGQRLARFRSERFEKIATGDTPVPLIAGPKLVLQTVPVSGMQGAQRVEPLQASRQLEHLAVPDGAGSNYRYNFDGYLVFSQRTPGSDPTSFSYTQAFRNAAVEYVTSAIHNPINSEQKIFGRDVERLSLVVLQRYLSYFRALEIVPPVYVMLSLVNSQGYQLAGPGYSPMSAGHSVGQHAIDRARLTVPEVLLEDFEQPITAVLKPMFDVIWQAAGWSGSPYYDETGNWLPV